ncbi:DUF58 domain-containing protein [Candidatus Solincola sp.]|nr:DUF58 domain-containing protein [Actinomycetota bacterium]
MFSARSLTVVALSLAMILIGINSQSGWLFWLAGLLLAALLVSWLESLFQVRNLDAERSLPPRAVEGEDLEVEIRVRNGGRFSRHLLAVVDADPCESGAPARFSLKVARRSIRDIFREVLAGGSEEADGDRHPGGTTVLLLPRLAGAQEAVLKYRRGGLRRGVYRDWPLYFYSEGTLGLSRHSSRITPDSRLEVHPSYVELTAFPFLDVLLYPWREPLPVASRGEGLDFYGVREYQPGDPLGRVHWRTTARRGDLVVREFEAERSTRLFILLDNRGGDLGGWKARDRLDLQARVAASAAAYAWSVGCPVTLAAYRGSTPVIHDAPGLQSALGWLAALEAEGEPGPREQLEGLRHRIPRGALVCQIMAVSAPADLPRPPSMPQGSRLAWILVTGSDGKKWQPSGNGAGSLEDLLRRGYVELPPTLEGIAVCIEGDDLGKCLENPCVTCAGWRRPGM